MSIPTFLAPTLRTCEFCSTKYTTAICTGLVDQACSCGKQRIGAKPFFPFSNSTFIGYHAGLPAGPIPICWDWLAGKRAIRFFDEDGNTVSTALGVCTENPSLPFHGDLPEAERQRVAKGRELRAKHEREKATLGEQIALLERQLKSYQRSTLFWMVGFIVLIIASAALS